ncbi:FAD-binding oxidoreductase [Nakamurella endophytica]|uniref:Oxidoreductase n=1 Tax=Nakamurella endophytica TaxID=1748367 RepID=A0A917T8S8_9ACTN|nr:FAD-binding oxidoreductase [Nakamurella endophytica]GGM11925.1 oxidoreductase [Nakamurella endophytica]
MTEPAGHPVPGPAALFDPGAPDLPTAPIGGWRTAIVHSVRHPTPRSVAIRLDVPDRVDHWPGQHYVVRLTAEDGYTASRSYSVASAPADPQLELYVERLEDGEVSSFLADELRPGDPLEIRGPIGGWFVWTGGRPATAVGGGSGVVPFVSMLRHAVDLDRTDLLSLVVAARTLADLPYADELRAAGARIVLSREDRPDRPAGRLSAADLAGVPVAGARCLVCGSAGFAETASRLLVDAGADPAQVRVERFGPSGGPAPLF